MLFSKTSSEEIAFFHVRGLYSTKLHDFLKKILSLNSLLCTSFYNKARCKKVGHVFLLLYFNTALIQLVKNTIRF